ncbi:hypothetical protein PV328_011828, partial [Microctonus aethiopoides]
MNGVYLNTIECRGTGVEAETAGGGLRDYDFDVAPLSVSAGTSKLIAGIGLSRSPINAAVVGTFDSQNLCVQLLFIANMDIGVNITKNLSPKKIKFLEFVSPHTRNYDAVLEKICDSAAGPEAYQFRRDLIEFHDSVMQIERLREDETNEYNCKVCPRCECVKKSDATIERMIKKITYFARELKMNLQHMNREVQKLSEEKIADNAVDGSQGIVVSAAGVNNDDNEGYEIVGNEHPMSLHCEKQCCAESP